MRNYLIAAGVGIILGLALYVVTSQAKILVKVVEKGTKTDVVEILGVRDNNNGTGTVVLVACGTKIEITASFDDFANHAEEIDLRAEEEYKKACGK